MPFFDTKTDQRNEANLAIDVHRGEPEEGEHQGPRKRQRHRAKKDDKRITETLELRREDQKYENEGKNHGRDQRVPLLSQLAGLACVVDNRPGRQDLFRLVLEDL